MLNNLIFRKALLFVAGAVLFASCDSDFNSIGTDIVGDDHFGFEKDDLSTVTAFSQKTGVVQSNNLPINPLGVFDNGAFGKTTAHFVTQVQLASENPSFENVTLARIKSVILKVPYFSTLKETDVDGNNLYELDSIYGSVNNNIKLSVYENGYYLRDFDPNDNFQSQKFYSDQNATFDAVKRGNNGNGGSVVGGTRLNDATQVRQNDQFYFSPDEIVIPATDEDEDPVKEAPAMRLNLNKEYFYNRLFATDDANLVNNNVFKNYFKGLYFQVQQNTASALAMMDFSNGTITVTYDDDVTTTVNGVESVEVKEKTLVLNLLGNTVSLLEHTATASSTAYENATGNPILGNEKLYLKGNDGSVAFVDLFGGENSAELEALRVNAISNKWLINEANLVFYVDQDAMVSTIDPNRIFLYDAKNSRAVVDYNYDTFQNNSKPKYGKVTYGGIVELTGDADDTDRKGIKYKIRITEHIKNVLLKDSTNVRLGLSITEDINRIAFASLKTPSTLFSKVPVSSVMSPLGTVLYGNVPSPANADKRLKLEIYYTKPN